MAKEGAIIFGYEVVAGGFEGCEPDILHVLTLLEQAGLAFMLETPCRVLEGDIAEFYSQAEIDRGQDRLKSTVRGVRVRVRPSSLNRFLQLPVVEEVDVITQEDTDAAMIYCGLPAGASSGKRTNMNAAGKLLTDIVGKAILCKVKSHDYASTDMFKLLTVIIRGKRYNWGKLIFDKLKLCRRPYTHGRIFSLYLSEVDPAHFSMNFGTALHHTQKIDRSLLGRWRRQPPRQPAAVHSPPPAQEELEDIQQQEAVQQRASPPAHIEGEPALDEFVFQQQQQLSPEVQMVVREEEVVRQSPMDTGGQGVAPVEGERPEEDLAAIRLARGKDIAGEGEHDLSSAQDPGLALSAVLVLHEDDPPPGPSTSVFAHVEGLDEHSSEFVSNEDVAPQPSSVGGGLLGAFEAMLAKQQSLFEASQKQLFDQQRLFQAETRQGLLALRHEVSQFKTVSDNWMSMGGKAILTLIQENRGLHEQIDALGALQEQDRVDTNKFRNFMDAELQKLGEQLKAHVSNEVKKGEEEVWQKMNDAEINIKQKIDDSDQKTATHAKNIATDCYHQVIWLRDQIFQVPSSDPQPPQHEQEQEQPRFSPQVQVASGSGDVEIIESSTSSLKRKPREHEEVWDKVSKNIILDTFKYVMDHGGKREDYYSESEWKKYMEVELKRKIHLSNKVPGPPPSRYFPKPFAYFDRMKNLQKEKQSRKE